MRTMSARLALVLTSTVLALSLPLDAFAQNPSVWLVPGGGVVFPTDELGIEHNRPTFGGILGCALSQRIALEARGHYASSKLANNLKMLHGEGNLTYFLFNAEDQFLTPYLTAGGGVMRLEDDSTSENKFAWNAGGGFRVRLSSRMALRIDVRDVSYKLPATGGRYLHSADLFGGLSFGFGGKAKDADGDGVPDKRDTCPGTPLGARVDANGCPSDSDKDGVLDGLDQCPDTPQGASVNEKGCPSDSDKDGVLDGIDRCADTPQNARVDVTGCPLDADADGVYDGIDKCDATPTGCKVNAEGCPSDSDQDGICDGVDRCPDTPANARVDLKGCPIVVSEKETELLETGMIRLQNVNFDTGKSTIKPESDAALDDVGTILSKWPELRIEIGGHTDSRGGAAYNQTLSEERAKAVLDYLIAKFTSLKSEQYTTVGYGESKPIAPNTTQLGMAKNRRVEFKVLNTDVLKRVKEEQKMVPKE